MCRLDLGHMVTGHYWNLRIIPHDDSAQKVVVDSVSIDPDVPEMQVHDGWGNVVYAGGCQLSHNTFGYQVSGTAEVDSRQGRGTTPNELFRYPSHLTQPGPALVELHRLAGAFGDAAADVAVYAMPVNAAADVAAPCTASACPALGHGVDPTAIFQRAFALSHLVHESMEYVSGSTTVLTTAEEAIAQHKGVCQDYTHILLALMRMDRIQARYVGGLMLGEGATHAWVEFYDGCTWWGVDPTNDCEAGDYYIALVRGRDHSDCPMEQGVFTGVGLAMQRMITRVKVAEL